MDILQVSYVVTAINVLLHQMYDIGIINRTIFVLICNHMSNIIVFVILIFFSGWYELVSLSVSILLGAQKRVICIVLFSSSLLVKFYE